jgi:6-pyruvoyltetrahydropterin/6-carboxytetrahydropterin synthase
LSEPIYEITVETSFSASHQLRNYEGDIEPLHGHNFRVEASVASPELDEMGVVVDFLELEALLQEVLAPYDHLHLNDLEPFDRLNPSTENMARLFFEKLQEKLAPRRLEVRRIRVWEAPTYSASYRLP